MVDLGYAAIQLQSQIVNDGPIRMIFEMKVNVKLAGGPGWIRFPSPAPAPFAKLPLTSPERMSPVGSGRRSAMH